MRIAGDQLLEFGNRLHVHAEGFQAAQNFPPPAAGQ